MVSLVVVHAKLFSPIDQSLGAITKPPDSCAGGPEEAMITAAGVQPERYLRPCRLTDDGQAWPWLKVAVRLAISDWCGCVRGLRVPRTSHGPGR